MLIAEVVCNLQTADLRAIVRHATRMTMSPIVLTTVVLAKRH